MDIGTAKLLPEEQKVPHHLIDILDPGEPYSAQLFQEHARAAFLDIYQRGKVPILCGGTGFYVQAALEDMRFPEGEQQNNPFRATLEAFRQQQGNDALWNLLKERDEASAALIHPHNYIRVIRALEMHEEGISYASQVENIKILPEVVWSLRFFLKVDPYVLAQRINNRVDSMRSAGLVDEVDSLVAHGFTDALTAPKAIGYKEIIAAKRGEVTLDRAFEQIKTATRRYAKRQRSWFRRDQRLHILDADRLSEDEMTTIICNHYRDALASRIR
jgi:tRNA dimethylallyltransferase